MTFSFPLFSVIPAVVLAYLPHFIRIAILTRAKKFDNTNPRATATEQPELTVRLAGAHSNQLEMLGAYAAGIVANVARGRSDTQLDIYAGLYIGFRVLYVLVYAAPQIGGGYVRTAVFVACMNMLTLIWVKAAA